jgi:radical SAM protein with 4Fe4S-binding SPASM domain
MDLATAKAAIFREFTNSNEYDEIQIDLFGGEPTLRPDFIRELVEWTMTQHFHKKYIFFLQTNGTLVHGDFQQWLIKHRCVWVGLSMDGSRETHNFNRSNSYDAIDYTFFATHYPAQGVRMTVAPATVANLANDVIHLHGLGFKKVDATIAYGICWNPALEPTLENQLKILADYYLDHPDLPECSLFNMKIVSLGRVPHKEKWCGTGTAMISIGVDGRRYPCQAFQPSTSSYPAELGTIELGLEDFSDPECSSCALKGLCPTCYGLNYQLSGNIIARDMQMCFISKARARAVAYLRANQIARGLLELSSVDTYRTIEAIKYLQTI